MDQRELRAAMDHAVAVAPPPMRDEPVLVAGRQALERRRAAQANIGSAAVVALIAAGVAMIAPVQDRTPAGEQLSVPRDTAAPPPGASVTATTGTRDDRGAALAAALDALAPAGYATPGDLKGVGDHTGRTLKNHEAFSVGVVDGIEVWNYSAGTPLTKDGGVGELIATVFTPGRRTTGEGCALTPTTWDASLAHCTEVNVDGKKVAVADVTYPPRDGLAPVQWAGYRHADGTVVFVMQTAGVARSGHPALSAMPMTGQQLAAVAVDPRLRPQ